MNNSTNKENTIKRWGFVALGVLVLAAMGISVYAFSQNNRAENSRVAQIVSEPEKFTGEKTSITGRIDRIVGSSALTIDNPQLFGDELLVISTFPIEAVGGSGPGDFLFNTNERVTVSGEIREFHLRDVEEELGVDLVDEVFASWEGKPFIVADTINKEL